MDPTSNFRIGPKLDSPPKDSIIHLSPQDPELNSRSTFFKAGLAYSLCAIFLGISAIQAQEMGQLFGKAIYVEGEVLITRDLLDFEVKIEDEFQIDDEIETGADGKLQISFGSSFLSIGPKTIITVGKRKEGVIEMISITLEQGRFRSKVFLEARQGYEVVSEHGIALVHGTDFISDVGDGRSFFVTVIEGEVGMNPVDQGDTSNRSEDPIVLQASQSGSMNDRERSSDIKVVSPEAIVQIKKELPLPGDNEDEKVVNKEHTPVVDGGADIPDIIASSPLADIDVSSILQGSFNIDPAPLTGIDHQQNVTQAPFAPSGLDLGTTSIDIAAIIEQIVQQTNQAIVENVQNSVVSEINRQRDEIFKLVLTFTLQVD